LDDTSKFPNLTRALLEKGYTPEMIANDLSWQPGSPFLGSGKGCLIHEVKP
jgi:hypothetical protein